MRIDFASRPLRSAHAGINFLIFVSVLLCALVGYQWYRETSLQEVIRERNGAYVKLDEEKKTADATVQRYEGEIKRIDKLRSEFEQLIKTNKAQISSLSFATNKLSADVDRLTRERDAYKDAYDKTTENAKLLSEGIQKLQNLYNSRTAEYKELIDKYKDLASQAERANKEMAALADKYNQLVNEVNAQREKEAKEKK